MTEKTPEPQLVEQMSCPCAQCDGTLATNEHGDAECPVCGYCTDEHDRLIDDCPLCGSFSYIINQDNICCSGCSLELTAENEEKAIAVWNRRPATPGAILNECIAELGDTEPFVVSRDGEGWTVRTLAGWRVLEPEGGEMATLRYCERQWAEERTAFFDMVRDKVIAAYDAGATDVHGCWIKVDPNGPPRGDPDFTEAAHDYFANITALSGRRDEGEGS